jgi:hypothetical protein
MCISAQRRSGAVMKSWVMLEVVLGGKSRT